MNQSTTNDDPDRKDASDGKDQRADHGDPVEDAEVVTPETAAAKPDIEPKAESVGETAVAAAPDTSDDTHDEEHHGSGTLAGMALRFLVIVLVVFGLSLWLVPMIAPHLPATIARHIMPGQKELDARLANLDDEVSKQTESALADVAAMKKQVDDLAKRLVEAEAAAAKAQAEAAAAREEAAKSAKAATTATVAEDVVTKAEGAAKAAAEAADTATTAATEAGKVAAAATRDAASLARRMTSFEARVAALSDEIGAMGEALAKAPVSSGDGGGASPELAAAFAALKVKVDGLAKNMDSTTKFLKSEDADRFATQDDLRSARTALQAEVKDQIAALPAAGKIATKDDLSGFEKEVNTSLASMGERITAVEKTAGEASTAAKAASEASSKAAGKVDSAIRDASVRSGVAALMSRLDNGVSYASALAELEELTGIEAPAELRTPAEKGVATAEDLRRGFGRKAQAAISADIRAAADDDGVLGKASARLQSVVAGRPKNAEEGDDVPAIVSRIEASLRDGNLTEALAESQALSDPAKEAMASWLADLTARVGADKAAKAYIDELTRQQG